MITFKQYLIELSNKVLLSYKSKASPDIMHQILKKSDKHKAAKRAQGVSKVDNMLTKDNHKYINKQ